MQPVLYFPHERTMETQPYIFFGKFNDCIQCLFLWITLAHKDGKLIRHSELFPQDAGDKKQQGITKIPFRIIQTCVQVKGIDPCR